MEDGETAGGEAVEGLMSLRDEDTGKAEGPRDFRIVQGVADHQDFRRWQSKLAKATG